MSFFDREPANAGESCNTARCCRPLSRAVIWAVLITWGLRPRLYADTRFAGNKDLVAEGDFMDLEFTFTRHGKTVAEVSRQWFSFADTYGVNVQPGEDDVLILASTVVIDMVRSHRENRNL